MQMHGIDSSVVFDNREWPCVIVAVRRSGSSRQPDLPFVKSGYG